MTRLNSRIHEVIVTTIAENGQPHSAPMGVSEVSGYFHVKPFQPSQTYDNLKRTGQCTLNFTDDVRIFAGALTGHRDWPTRPCNKIDGAYLTAALAHIELKIAKVDDLQPRACFYGELVAEEIHAPFRGFNRAQSAVIEAAILASRLQMLPTEKIQQELAYLTIAIEKTAGERELEAWGWLMDKIKQAGINIE